MSNIRLLIALAVILLYSCNHTNPSAGNTGGQCIKQYSLPIKYAKGFTIDYYDGFKVITVKSLKDTTRTVVRYVVMPKGKAVPVGFEDAVVIDTPVTKVVCISTSHIAELRRLGLIQYMVAISGKDLIYDKEVLAAINKGTIADLGNDELNYEKLLELAPDFVFTSGGWDGGDKMKNKLDALHVKTVENLDYMEQHPVARVEWLKFVGAFFNMEYEADSIFKAIDSSYNALRSVAVATANRPTVFCNMPFKEVWYMPSGETYMARFITDAGGHFLWSKVPANNGLNLNLDYEAVYSKAANADFWINPGFAHNLAEIEEADKKNAFFKAFKTKHVYNCNLRNTAADGFDIWESGAVSPDIILADLISILHPDVLPGHQLYYYQKLK